ncbi:MAG: hypothetical protein MUD17_00925 [Gemmatimonadaceae bacterium]|jgi:hypothetical protein|nr:hypothetical protein [Gemmatimonadaceae bacterium]
MRLGDAHNGRLCRATRRKGERVGERRTRRGFALEAVLLLMLIFAVIVMAGLSAVQTLTRTSAIDYRSTQVAYAAEAGADDIMSQLDAAMQDGVIGATDIAGLASPALPGFAFDTDTRTTAAPEARTITSGPFAGLISLNQPIDIEVTATDSMRNRSQVVLSVNAQSIPLFQFGVFYEEDLEILPGQPMVFAGWVHSNSNLYLSSGSVTFQSQLTTPDSVFWQRKDRNERLNGVRIHNAAGSPIQLDFDSRSHAGAAFVTRSTTRFNNRLMSGASGVRALRLPLPAGMNSYTLIEPRQGGDNAMVQDVKLAWKSDWYIELDVANLATPCASMVQARAAGRALPTAAQCAAIFTGRPNAFFDGREDLRPDLLDVNMAALRTWVAADPGGRRVDILYVRFTGRNAGITERDYPALRLVNGAELPASWSPIEPGGLSIATDHPLYVRGDYNSVNWKPAAFYADAITFLSNNWNDGLQANFARRAASALTTANVAIAAGHSATTCDWQRAGCGAPIYGGGLENFPRFLEDWGGGRIFRYTGSLVSLFESAKSTGDWGNTVDAAGNAQGAYYNPPTRQWSFDLRFRDPRMLPPGTPRVGTVIQTAFRPVF